jgi:DNA modification methylase
MDGEARRHAGDAIRDVTKRGDMLDPFAGGSTLIAAEKTGRQARASNMSPNT